MRVFLRSFLFGAAAAAAQNASAQTIYPVDRAEILTGEKFDLKVEFPGKPASANVTVNGQDAAAFFGKPASFVEGGRRVDLRLLAARGIAAQGR